MIFGEGKTTRAFQSFLETTIQAADVSDVKRMLHNVREAAVTLRFIEDALSSRLGSSPKRT